MLSSTQMAEVAELHRDAATAVLIAEGKDAPIDWAFEEFRRRFSQLYPQIIFLSIGVVDTGVTDAPDFESAKMESRMQEAARKVVENSTQRARQSGMAVGVLTAMGTDPVDE